MKITHQNDEKDPENDPLYLLTKSIEKGDPEAAQKVKSHLNNTDIIT